MKERKRSGDPNTYYLLSGTEVHYLYLMFQLGRRMISKEKMGGELCGECWERIPHPVVEPTI